ncbi:hypothetical protein EWB00_009021 [Schistosoma japonicum]|uniref:Arb2 domain-containing protein n=1 Tax=Schistosoma japonicum TaxID=6182 RepID=A0A4Z2DS33_SCHJA|nr:hypothetical protein EWB00_009021 [Schistosoma japonicum]
MKKIDESVPSCDKHIAEEVSPTTPVNNDIHITPQVATSLPSRIELVRPIYTQISDFCFDFDSEGILRHVQTGETFSVKMTSTGPSLKRQEIIRAICTRLIRQRLFAINMESSQIPIPGHPSQCMRVLHSANFFTHKGPIIILLQGGGVAQAGVWAPRLLLHPQHGLHSGSQIDLVKKAHEQGYAIAIINANEHVPSEAEMDAMETFSNSAQPAFDITKCIHFDPNLKPSSVNVNNHDVSIYLTLPDHSKKLILPMIDNNFHQPGSSNSNLDNPIFIVPCKSSIEQDTKPESKRLFQPCSTSTSTPASSSSSALSWLLTGSNSSSSTVQADPSTQSTPVCCMNSTYSTNKTCLTAASVSDTINTQAKPVCFTNNASSLSSSQPQRHAFSVQLNNITSNNLIQVTHGSSITSNDMNSVNSSNCQPFVNNSICIPNAVDNSTVKKSPVICRLSTTSSLPTEPTTVDSSSSPVDDKSRNFAKTRSSNNDPKVSDVSLEDRIYGIWRQLIPHCASKQILVWAHQQGANAFIHPFKPMPDIFPGFLSSLSTDSRKISSIPVSTNKMHEKSDGNCYSTNNQFEQVVLPTIHNVSETLSDHHYNCLNSIVHSDTKMQIDKHMELVDNFSNGLKPPTLNTDTILRHTCKKPRLCTDLNESDPYHTQVSRATIPSNNNNNINNGICEKSNIRFTRRRHLSAGPILMTYKNENTTRKSVHVLERAPEYEQLQPHVVTGVSAIPGEIEEMRFKVSSGRLWLDRRIYGPWRHHVTPEASRRAFRLSDDSDLLNNSSKKNTINSIIKQVDDRLPATSGNDADAILFAKCGGVIPRSVGIWSNKTSSDEFLQLRLARAWQRKAERMWRELKSRVKAVVFTDSADVLDLPTVGVGWGLCMLNEQNNDSNELPSIYKPSIYQDKLPEKVLQFREWLSQNSVNYVAANLELGSRLNPQVDAQQQYAIPILSSSTTEHDLIPSTVIHHVFEFFQTKLKLSCPSKDDEFTPCTEPSTVIMENSSSSALLPSVH